MQTAPGKSDDIKMPRETFLKLRCQACDSGKVSVKCNITASPNKEYSLPGGIIGGLVAGLPGALAGALLCGGVNIQHGISIQYICEECDHSDNSCTIENSKGERLDEFEVRELLENREDNDEVYLLSYVGKNDIPE